MVPGARRAALSCLGQVSTNLSFAGMMESGVSGGFRTFATFSKEVVAKGSEKKGTTKSTKKSFSFPSWPSWFKAFMLFATTQKAGSQPVESAFRAEQ